MNNKGNSIKGQEMLDTASELVFAGLSSNHAIWQPTPNRRAQAKARTRAKILAAAHDLFESQGYESATIRDIAHAAGMSTGAVFACFDDKAQLFEEILRENTAGELPALQQAIGSSDDLMTCLLAYTRACYDSRSQRLALVRATMAASWTRDDKGLAKIIEALAPGIDLVAARIEQARQAGEIPVTTETSLLVSIFWTLHSDVYKLAIYRDASVDSMVEMFAQQFGIVMKGVRNAL